MKRIKLKVWNRLEGGNMVARELPSSNSSYGRWIAIYPIFPHPELQRKYPNDRYKVMEYELPLTLLDYYFGEEDRQNLKEFFVSSEEELYKVFEELNVDPEGFDAPWHCRYPG